MTVPNEKSGVFKYLGGSFLDLVLFSYQSYYEWMRGRGNSKSVSSIYASFPLVFYIFWVLMGCENILSSSLRDETAFYGKWNSGIIYYIIVACSWIISAVYFRRRSEYALVLYGNYKNVSYFRKVLCLSLLLLPLPVMLAITRGEALLTASALIIHWMLMVILGNLMLRKIRLGT